MKLSDLPAIGAALEGGLFAGITTRADGTHCALVLLANKPSEPIAWKKAMAWAKKLKASLPTRPEAALLYARLKPQFEPAWHWTSDELDGSAAWGQDFYHGLQCTNPKSYEGRARAVRLIQLTA